MSDKCKFENCDKVPSFNYEGQKRLYCYKHKFEGMTNVVSQMCQYENCKKQSYFNYDGQTFGMFCKKHKLEDMIDVKNTKCQYEECNKIPYFNFEKQTRGIFCGTHKLKGMINVVSKTCQYENCKKSPYYNYEGQTPGILCGTHKLGYMINVKDRKCNYEGCKTRPSYNFKGQSQRLYCNKHKLKDMINIANKICQFENCETQAYFNVEGQKQGLYCKIHKLVGMIDVKNKKCCQTKWVCNMLVNSNNKKYEGFCLFCFINEFPNKPVSRNYKTKEKTVTDFVLSHFPIQNYSWITDKTIVDGCSRRRPDMMLDLGYQVIIVEIDENQHNNYDCSCSNKRLMELSLDVGHRPIIFIRFNPDCDFNMDNKKISSCWSVNKQGIITIKKQKEWLQRLDVLKDQITYWCNNESSKIVEVIQLFYDMNV